MNDRSVPPQLTLSISSVERDTGLSKDTLRVWERRYGFPQPSRDGFGERVYPLDQVDRLRIIRRLMDAGHRPGKIIGLDSQALQELAGGTATAAFGQRELPLGQEDLARYIELVKSHQVPELRGALAQATLRLGLDRFVVEVAAPLSRMVGEAWAAGYFEIFEEHLYTESMQVVLRNAISSIPSVSRRPRVLLTTFPNEAHGLGLLMAEAILALAGCRCVSLGVQTPLWDIALAAGAQQVDVVALSFSAAANAGQAIEGLAQLRAKLAPAIEIWAGGGCRVLRRKPPDEIRVLSELTDIHRALEHWRAAHPEY